MRKKIIQVEDGKAEAEVVRLKRILDTQRMKWSRDYPGGTCLGSITRERDWLCGRIEGARLLKMAVVVIDDGHGKITFFALPQEV